MAKPRPPFQPKAPAPELSQLPPPPPQAAAADLPPPAEATPGPSYSELVTALHEAFETCAALRTELEQAHKLCQGCGEENESLRFQLAETQSRFNKAVAENRHLRAQKAPQRPNIDRRNFAFQMSNGSRVIRPGCSEKEARANLAAELGAEAAAGAKFKGCP